MLAGGFAYYQAQYSRKAKKESARERKMAEHAEKLATESASLARQRLETMDAQTAIFREHSAQLKSISEALTSGFYSIEISDPQTQRPHIEKTGKNTFAIVNPTDKPLVIQGIRNKEEFVIIDLDEEFVIAPYAQKTFIAVGTWQVPLPDNLILDEKDKKAALNMALPTY